MVSCDRCMGLLELELTRIPSRVRLEEILLIIGACAPALKRPIESLLHRFGLPQFGPVERELNSVHTVPETTNKPERCIYDGPQGSWSGGLSPAPEA